jgi:hypothetical protein
VTLAVLKIVIYSILLSALPKIGAPNGPAPIGNMVIFYHINRIAY